MSSPSPSLSASLLLTIFFPTPLCIPSLPPSYLIGFSSSPHVFIISAHLSLSSFPDEFSVHRFLHSPHNRNGDLIIIGRVGDTPKNFQPSLSSSLSSSLSQSKKTKKKSSVSSSSILFSSSSPLLPLQFSLASSSPYYPQCISLSNTPYICHVFLYNPYQWLSIDAFPKHFPLLLSPPSPPVSSLSPSSLPFSSSSLSPILSHHLRFCNQSLSVIKSLHRYNNTLTSSYFTFSTVFSLVSSILSVIFIPIGCLFSIYLLVVVIPLLSIVTFLSDNVPYFSSLHFIRQLTFRLKMFRRWGNSNSNSPSSSSPSSMPSRHAKRNLLHDINIINHKNSDGEYVLRHRYHRLNEILQVSFDYFLSLLFSSFLLSTPSIPSTLISFFYDFSSLLSFSSVQYQLEWIMGSNFIGIKLHKSMAEYMGNVLLFAYQYGWRDHWISGNQYFSNHYCWRTSSISLIQAYILGNNYTVNSTSNPSPPSSPPSCLTLEEFTLLDLFLPLSLFFGFSLSLSLFNDLFSLLTLPFSLIFVPFQFLYGRCLSLSHSLLSLYSSLRGRRYTSHPMDQQYKLLYLSLCLPLLYFLFPTLFAFYIYFAFIKLFIVGMKTIIWWMMISINGVPIGNLILKGYYGKRYFTGGIQFHVEYPHDNMMKPISSFLYGDSFPNDSIKYPRPCVDENGLDPNGWKDPPLRHAVYKGKRERMRTGEEEGNEGVCCHQYVRLVSLDYPLSHSFYHYREGLDKIQRVYKPIEILKCFFIGKKFPSYPKDLKPSEEGKWNVE